MAPYSPRYAVVTLLQPRDNFCGVRRGVFPSLVLLVIPLGGCALIAGVDFQKGDCPGGCADGQVNADSMMMTDGGGGMDATIDSVADAPQMDGSAGDSALGDSGVDTGVDTGVDGGCGPLNTIQNCTMCGAACDTTHSNGASCNGSTCLYQSCQMSWSNCTTTAPDLAGCECNTPSCCGSSCQTVHQNGIGQNFYDCVAQGTFNFVQGVEACAAYTGNQNVCMMYTCTQPKDLLICGVLNGVCACWDYSGVTPGKVHLSNNMTCYCAGSNDPSWN